MYIYLYISKIDITTQNYHKTDKPGKARGAIGPTGSLLLCSRILALVLKPSGVEALGDSFGDQSRPWKSADPSWHQGGLAHHTKEVLRLSDLFCVRGK